ncbi:MAG: CPBP family intramembrane metalloprotease [Ruminococcaceae bacterium]|nr:CPBP family intramembrane metalloprotease [Oscillospiraceae bacterium]
MSETVAEKRNFISDLNKIFLLFTVIKSLLTFFSPLFFKAVKGFFESINMKDPSAAIDLAFSLENPCGILINTSFYLLCVTIPTAMYFAIRKGHNVSDHKFLTSPPTLLGSVHAVFSTFGVVFSFSFAQALVMDLLSKNFGTELPVQEIVLSAEPKMLPLYIAFFGILPSFSEEILTRGLLMRSLAKMGKTYAIIISSLAFMFMHDDATSFLFTFISGVCIAYFSVKYNSVSVGILIHFCLNTNTVILNVLSQYTSTERGNLIYLLYFSVLLFTSLGFLLFNTLKMTYNRFKGKIQHPEKTVFEKKLLFKCPFFYIFITVSLISAVLNIASTINQ